MTIRERQDKAEVLFQECLEILRAKGMDYAGDADSLANFKDAAEDLGQTKYQVWATYFAKHYKSIMNSIKANPKQPQTESEPLRGRLHDIINYAAILSCLLDEDEETKSLPF